MSYYDGKAPSRTTHVGRFAQQHQRPVKSARGGYLRCPFDVSAAFADLAVKHVAAGGRNPRANAAPFGLGHHPTATNKDGLEKEEKEEKEGEGFGRAWTRAGVGAQQLSAKEKRSQQELAELIYNNNSSHRDDDEGEVVGDGANTLQQENKAEVREERKGIEGEVDGGEGGLGKEGQEPPIAESCIAPADGGGVDDAAGQEEEEQEDDDDDGMSNIIAKGRTTGRSIWQTSAEKSRRTQFGLDAKEQQALRKAMPRFLRPGRRGDAAEDGNGGSSFHRKHTSDVAEPDDDDERMVLSKARRLSSASSYSPTGAPSGQEASPASADGDTGAPHAQRGDIPPTHGPSQRARKKDLKRQRESGAHGGHAGELVAASSTGGPREHVAGQEERPKPEASPPPPPPPLPSQKTPAPPMNRMQKLEEARLAALLGKKRKRETGERSIKRRFMFQRLRDQLFGASPGTSLSVADDGATASDTGSNHGAAMKAGYRPHHGSSSLSLRQQRDPLSSVASLGSGTRPPRQQKQQRSLTRPSSSAVLDIRQHSTDLDTGGAAPSSHKGMRRASSSLNILTGSASPPPSQSAPPASAGSSPRQQPRADARSAASSPHGSPTSQQRASAPVRGTGTVPLPQNLAASLSASTAGYAPPAEERFLSIMNSDPVDMQRLRELGWHGCPVRLRYDAWCLMTGYWHPQHAQRGAIVARKRREYVAHVEQAYSRVDWDAVCAVLDSGDADSATLRWHVEEQQQQRQELAAGRWRSSGSSGGGGGGGSSGPTRGSGPLHSFSAQHLFASPHGSPASTAMDEGERERTMSASSSSASRSHPLLRRGGVEGRQTGPHIGSGGVVGTATTTTTITAPPRISPGAMTSSSEAQIMKQIRKDIPRMSGGVAWLQHPRVRASMERILFIWSVRHPACGYVQGMNDFVVPFLGVVLAHRYCATKSISELYSYDDGVAMEKLGEAGGAKASTSDGEEAEEEKEGRRDTCGASSEKARSPPYSNPPTDDTYIQKCAVDDDAVWIGELEADTYWLTSYVLSVMQDNYTRQQRGITAMVKRLEGVLAAADVALYKHLTQELNVEVPLFAFRWINCLLLRELTVTQSLRLFDTYLSDESREWSTSHVFTCCALLLRMSGLLMGMTDFAVALHTLQNPPTERLSAKDMSEIISEAYVLQCLYANVTAAPPPRRGDADGGGEGGERSSYAPAHFARGM